MYCRWDESKNQLNSKKHEVRFEEAQTIFDDPLALSIVDPDHSHNEERWLTIGMSDQGRLLIVAHTYAAIDAEVFTRIISARKPTARERKAYEEKK